VSAQDQYRQMIKDCITPALRERGWRGGSSYYYMTGATGHLGTLQLSGNHARSTTQVRTFSLHVGVRSRYFQELVEATGQPVTKRPTSTLEHDWMESVASFTIAADDDPLDVGGFVLMTIESQAIPLVTASLEDAGLRQAVDFCAAGVGGGEVRTLMEIAQGNFEEARSRIAASEDHFGYSDPGVVFLRGRLHEAMASLG
jgi:hypothetical protein